MARIGRRLAALALASLLIACGGGGDEDFPEHEKSPQPVDCGGGITCRT